MIDIGKIVIEPTSQISSEGEVGVEFKLPESVIDSYRNRDPDWGPLGEITYLRTYSRLVDGESRKEAWWECVRRVVEGTYQIQKEHCKKQRLPWNDRKAKKSAEIMYDKIFNFKFLPPGRGLWMMGTPFIKEKLGASLNNCFDGDTLFLTDKGTVSFKDTVGNKVNVLTKEGTFEEAEVLDFGIQPLFNIVIKPKGRRSNHSLDFNVTQNHRWLLSNGQETTSLKVGDTLLLNSNKPFIDKTTIEYKTGFAHGLIFGDGTRNTYYPERHFIKVYDGNGESYNEIMKDVDGYKGINRTDDNPVITIIRKENWKNIPDQKATSIYKSGFIDGWVSADSWSKPCGSICLDTIYDEATEWVMKESIHAGYIVTGISINSADTNFGKRTSPLKRISMTSKPVEFTVVSKTDLGILENVYCVSEPKTKSFTLAGGVLTGNCAFVSTEDINFKFSAPFAWSMDCLMLGVGVGFDALGAGQIKIKQPKPDGVFIIPDSRGGWVRSLELLLDGFFKGEPLPVFDYSIIRPYGAPIKGFGGTASGPEPLLEMHNRLNKMLTERIGDHIKSTDIVDIMDMIAACVVAGNVRRSALLSLGSPIDPEFANMKNYKDFPYETSQWRWASNNSINAEVGKTDYSAIAESIALNGEPGVVWMDNVRKYSRNKDTTYFVDKNAKGTNPCFTPKTLIHTRSGHFPIESLVGKSVEIWDGNSWILIDNFRITGQYQDMIEVELQDGSLIKTTLYHEYILENGLRVEGRNLKVGDKLSFSEAPLTHGIHKEPGAYLKGFLVGDGTTDGKKPILWLYEPKYMCEDRLIKSASEVELTKSRSDSIIDGRFDVVKSNKKEKKINRKIMQGLSVRKDELIRWCNEYKKNLPLSIFEWDEESKLNFIAGVLDSDGTASDTKNGWLYQVSSINEKWLMDFQLLLKTIGVNSKLSLMRKAGKTDFHDGYGEYKTKDCFRLTIAQCSSIVLAQKVIFSRLVSFAEKETIYKLRNKMNKIVNIRFAGVDEKVYCCTVPTNNTISLTCGIKTGQCSEQTLESYEICCLVETFPSRHDSYEEYKETLKYAYLYAKTVTLVPTEWQETNAVMLKNRRIGVSQSGIIDAFNRHGRRNMLRWCDQGYQVIKEYDEQYSNWFCVPRSIKVTSVKPSGTVSLLPGVSPGIHYPHSEFYIRRIRVASDNPLVDILKKAGYHTQFEAVGSEDERKKTTVVDFPIHEKNFSKKKDDVSIWEQVKNVVDYQNWWADNQVSVTVTFKKSEAKSIKDVLEMYEDQLKSISFLPISEHGYPLAPYEEISGDRYLEMLNKITKPDYSSITASAEGAKFCDSDHCEV